MLYGTGKVSINKIAKIFNMCWSLVYRWINESAEKLPDYKIKDDVKEIEFDEMWHFLYKKRKLWVIKAFDRTKNEMIAWITGSRSTETFKRLYDKVKHLKNCTFYTDSWDAFSKVLPKNHHVIGK